MINDNNQPTNVKNLIANLFILAGALTFSLTMIFHFSNTKNEDNLNQKEISVNLYKILQYEARTTKNCSTAQIETDRSLLDGKITWAEMHLIQTKTADCKKREEITLITKEKQKLIKSLQTLSNTTSK